MSLSPAVIDALVASGCTVEQLAAAVKASMADSETKLIEKRRKDAERQRKYRSDNAASQDVTVTECDKRDPSLSLPLSPQTPLTPTHTHPDNNTRARKGACPAKPEGVSEAVWSDFLDLRKRKRAPMTETALTGIKREAQKAGWTLESALAKCVARGWQGFEADWVNGEAKPAANDADPMMARLRARRAGPP